MTKAKESIFQKFSEKFNFPDEQKLMATLKATAFKQKPKKQNDGSYLKVEITDEQMYALLIVSDQYGLNPFTKEIYAYPDKEGIVPVVGIDGWLIMVNKHREMDGMEFVESAEWVIDANSTSKSCPSWIECVIYRKDRSHPVRIREYFDEVYRQPFSGRDSSNKPYTVDGPWQTHTKRMLRHKALIQCARVAFGFVGIYDTDEAERIIEGEVVDSQVDSGNYSPPAHLARQAAQLVARATKGQAWQAAIDYASQQGYEPLDMNYLIAEINKARQHYESALPNDPSSGPVQQAEAVAAAQASPLPSENPEAAVTH